MIKDIARWPQTSVQHIITDVIVTVHDVKSSEHMEKIVT